METIAVQTELFVKMVIDEWNKQNNNLTKLIASLSDEQLSKQIAPGKNTGVYITGHLIAVSDGMLPLLGFGKRLFPHHENIFIKNPDDADIAKPSVAELRDHLQTVNDKLNGHLRSLSAEEWFKKHEAVSEEDFAKEPHRNRLNVVLNRSSHMSYHVGQLVLLK